MPSSKKLNRLLLGELDNSKAFQAGAMGIGQLTRQRAEAAQSRLATSGLGRSGIGGSIFNRIYGTAGQSFAGLAGEEASRRSQIINQLLGLYKFDKEFEERQTDIGDIFGGAIGLLSGSALGGLGAGIGDKLSRLIT